MYLISNNLPSNTSRHNTIEWVVQDNVVKIAVSNEHSDGTDLASSLYREYKNHFFPLLQNTKLAQYYRYTEIKLDDGSESFMFKRVLEVLLDSWKWIYTTFPLLKTTLSIFDIPGLIAREHHDIW